MPELFALLNLPTPSPCRYKSNGRMGLTMALGSPKIPHKGKHLQCGPIKHTSGLPEDRMWVEPKAPGAIEIICDDLDLMVEYYTDVIGLAPVSGSLTAESVTLMNPNSYGGHAYLVVLSSAPTCLKARAHSTLAHLTLSMGYAEQEAMLDWFDHLEHPYQIECLSWVGWCGVILHDPEGNAVEIVSIGSRN